MAVGQTVGVILLDSRFERRNKNVGKPPLYATLSEKLKESTDAGAIVVTNLDTWGSWYGRRKTVWFPLRPEMITDAENRGVKFDAIYLTNYRMDDENYYMGPEWREIFNNPENQNILPGYRYDGTFEMDPSVVYENAPGKAILLVKIK